ncbi:MAG: PD-(D/E)XK nuclease family protein [Anaerolineae bacterium]|nr:PD-(D/E)XK nuclease family protein [Anaerolineae bacterium]
MSKRKRKGSFAQRLLNLISEPEFIKFENILSEPNFFRIVGRSHYERWHSSFFGWLLDVSGSHLLSDYVLRRFLLLLLDDKCLKASSHSELFLANILPIVDFSDIEVTPNEYLPTETSVSGVGRFDVFLAARYVDESGNSGNLNIVFEFKIDTKPDSKQSTKYADWLLENHPKDANFLVYLTPNLQDSSEATVGDKRWYCLDYQLLNDKLLIPLLDHPNLNEKVKPFIIQYIKNLKTRYRGIKMAITNEEKRLALALYEKYSDVFDSIYDALVSTGTIDFTTSEVVEGKGRTSGRLAVRVDNKVFSNETLRLLFEDVLKYLVNQGYVLTLPLPWGSSKQRYIITNENPPTHPNGRPFFYPVDFEGYTMESHYARDRGMKVLNDLCDKLEIEFESIET